VRKRVNLKEASVLSGFLRRRGVSLAATTTVLLFGLMGATASANVIDITMTGTLSSGGAPFPWGFASNTIPASNFYSIDGDPFVANFQFDTADGSISTASGVTTLSGPATIASGDILVAGHHFAVPSCAIDPCATTTTALYSRSANFIEVLFYEDASASAGLVLQAFAPTSWGAGLTDSIPAQSVNSAGVDIILQPPGSYYNLAGFATVDTVSVAAPEPSTWLLVTAGVGMVGGAVRRRRRSVAAA
jgi:hypothetical protein